MKFGKDFGFWVSLILAILKALLPFGRNDEDAQVATGPRVVNAVLDTAVKVNEDDELGGLVDIATS